MLKIKELLNLEKSQQKLAIILILPTIIAVFFVLIYPLIYSFVVSFGNLELQELNKLSFVGFNNYINIIRDREFIDSLKVTMIFVFFTISIKLILGILVAVILNENFIGRSIARTLIIVPWAISYVVAGIMWKWMLNPKAGIINYILLKIGITEKYISFLASKQLALPSIIIAEIWKSTPFFIIIFLAGLQTIPSQLYEAASLDGASGIRSFFSITIPMIRLQIYISIVLGTISSISSFDLFYIMTQGGPANYTTNITFYNWINAFKYYHISYSSAISYMTLIITMLITIVYMIVVKRIKLE